MTEALSSTLSPSEPGAASDGIAEQAVLGRILKGGTMDGRFTSQLKSVHFFHPDHRQLFEAMEHCRDNGIAINIVTTHHEMAKLSKKEFKAERYVDLVLMVENIFPDPHTEDFARIVLDMAAQRAVAGAAVKASQETASLTFSADEIVAHIQFAVEANAPDETIGEGVSLAKATEGAIEMIQAAKENTVLGLPTGLKDLDAKIGGLHKSELIIIAGRPSMGKTSLATTIAMNVSRQGNTGIIFSVEVNQKMLAMSILSQQTAVDFQQLRTGRMNKHSLEQLAREAELIKETPLFIYDVPAVTVKGIRQYCRRVANESGLDFIVVDYIQLMKPVGTKKNESREREVANISMGLKSIAREFDIPLIALSQLNRSVESRPDKRPALSDLRDSGSLEQDADLVILLYRKGYYEKSEDPECEVEVAKQRHGPTGRVILHFRKECMRFGNYYVPDNSQYREVAGKDG